MKTHELKISPAYFVAVQKGTKRFEIRENDRGFKEGDILRLMEWDGETYTGRVVEAIVIYILYDFAAGLKQGYCIMSIEKFEDASDKKEICKNCGNAIKSNGWNFCPYCGHHYGDWTEGWRTT